MGLKAMSAQPTYLLLELVKQCIDQIPLPRHEIHRAPLFDPHPAHLPHIVQLALVIVLRPGTALFIQFQLVQSPLRAVHLFL